MNKYIFYAAITVLISSISQICLKSSANDKKTGIFVFLNVKVILAYFLFFGVTLINSIFIFKNIELSIILLVETLGFIYVPILSFFILKEKIEKKQILGIILIIIGAIIFAC